MNVFTKVLNSNFNTQRFSARCFSTQRPGRSGNSNAHHAFRSQASAVMTMYAQLLTRLSTGARSARTPPANCASRFSWSHRSLALQTISAAVLSPSLVM